MSFSSFIELCKKLTDASGHIDKTKILSSFLATYTGDIGRLYRFLLPKKLDLTRKYSLKEKQVLKLFSKIFKFDLDEVAGHFVENGDVSETVRHYYEKSKLVRPSASTLSLSTADALLSQLAKETTESGQGDVLQEITKQCTPTDLKYMIRLIMQDVKINAGLAILLPALHPQAHEAFKMCSSIDELVRRVKGTDFERTLSGGFVGEPSNTVSKTADKTATAAETSSKKRKTVLKDIHLGSPVSPMLADRANSVEGAVAKFKVHAFSEIKYDGERIQIHKIGDEFKYFSRNLKPMKLDKVEGLEKYFQTSVKARNCILDGEILLIDKTTGKPLPFGTLGKHKRTEFKEGSVCVFLFDCLYLNDRSLIALLLCERRDSLKDSIDFIKYKIHLSDMVHIKGTSDEKAQILRKHMSYAIENGLEGLVVKDGDGNYEPSARHWIKLKKDYMGIVDSVDAVVVGAYAGKGSKGGMMSTFLTAVQSKKDEGGDGKWKSFTKVATGLADLDLAEVNEALKKTVKPTLRKTDSVPPWLSVANQHIPDFIVESEAKLSMVLEVIGSEFIISKAHMADGICFRFPRVLKWRKDKDITQATSLKELRTIYKNSTKPRMGALGVRARNTEEGEEDMDEEDRKLLKKYQLEAKVKREHAAKAYSVVPKSSKLDEEPEERPSQHAPVKEPPKGGYQKLLTNWMGSAKKVDPPSKTLPMRNEEHVTKAQSPSPSLRAVLKGSLAYTNSSWFDPLGEEDMKILAHCVSVAGRWSGKGAMGQITSHFGTEPMSRYEEASIALVPGEVQYVKVKPMSTPSKIVDLLVASIVGQKAGDGGGAPTFHKGGFFEGIHKVGELALRHNASVHLQRLNNSIPDMHWGDIHEFLREDLVNGLGCDVYVYTRDASDLDTYGKESGVSIGKKSALQHDQFPFSPSPRSSKSPARSCSKPRTREEKRPRETSDDEIYRKETKIQKLDTITPHWERAETLPMEVPPIPQCGPPSRDDADTVPMDIVHGDIPFAIEEDEIDPSTILTSCRVLLDESFSATERLNLTQKVRELGGTVVGKWKSFGSTSTNYLISLPYQKPSGTRNHVEQLGGIVLSRSWVDECFRNLTKEPTQLHEL